MSKIGKPKVPKKSTASTAIEEALDDQGRDELKTMNLKFPAEFHREFKEYAQSKGMTMTGLVRQMYTYYRQHND